MRLFPLAAVAIALAGLSSFAHADDLFVLTGSGHTFTFQLPDSPTAISTSSLGFVDNSVAVNIDGAVSNHAIDFFNQGAGGGLAILNQNGGFSTAGLLVNDDGPVLYSGSDSKPTFLTGVYALTNYPEGQKYPGNYSLAITPVVATPVAATPEPGGLMLLGTGVMGLAGLVRRRLC